jgi:hypothetical protein
MMKTAAILMALLATAPALAGPINPGGGGSRAQDVTVAPGTVNLQADDVQEALAELQGDVNDINASPTMTVNGQWLFSGLVFRDTYLTVAATGTATTADGIYVWDTTQYEDGAFHKTTDGTTIETNAATAYSIRAMAGNWWIMTTRRWNGEQSDYFWTVMDGTNSYYEIDSAIFVGSYQSGGNVRVTVGRRHESVDREPYLIAYASTVTVSRANGDLQRLAPLAGSCTIIFDVGDTNYSSCISLEIPPTAGTNCTLLAGPDYRYGDSLTGPSTTNYTYCLYETPRGSTNRMVTLRRGPQ